MACHGWHCYEILPRRDENGQKVPALSFGVDTVNPLESDWCWNPWAGRPWTGRRKGGRRSECPAWTGKVRRARQLFCPTCRGMVKMGYGGAEVARFLGVPARLPVPGRPGARDHFGCG
jgi:hypothetical protein